VAGFQVIMSGRFWVITEAIRDGREIRKDRLRKMLSNPKWEWRTIEVLETAIGEDEKTTVDLLLEIGARRSEGDRNIWTLQA
jgi:predicted type IV restriction endonuclease